MLFFWVFGAVFSGLVSGAHFPTGFFAVAFSAEGLEVVEVVGSALCHIVDVVDFEVLCRSTFYALVAIAVEDFLADVAGCAF